MPLSKRVLSIGFRVTWLSGFQGDREQLVGGQGGPGQRFVWLWSNEFGATLWYLWYVFVVFVFTFRLSGVLFCGYVMIGMGTWG